MNVIAQNMPLIQEERFSDVIEEAQPLLERHWEEIALYKDFIPLSPNYARYAEMEASGHICVITARADGALIGYASFIIDSSLHYSTVRWAISDAIWLAPEHRGARIGNAMLDCAEHAVLARGVVVIRVEAKVAHPALAALLKSRGYAEADIVHAKVLQRPE